MSKAYSFAIRLLFALLFPFFLFCLFLSYSFYSSLPFPPRLIIFRVTIKTSIDKLTRAAARYRASDPMRDAADTLERRRLTDLLDGDNARREAKHSTIRRREANQGAVKKAANLG